MRGHAVQVLSVDETPRRVRGRAQVLCDAFGIGVWGPAEFESARGMLERGILAFACPTCGRGLVVDVVVASRTPEEFPPAANAPPHLFVTSEGPPAKLPLARRDRPTPGP